MLINRLVHLNCLKSGIKTKICIEIHIIKKTDTNTFYRILNIDVWFNRSNGNRIYNIQITYVDHNIVSKTITAIHKGFVGASFIL